MASEIKLPELGENVEEGEVVDVKVADRERSRTAPPSSAFSQLRAARPWPPMSAAAAGSAGRAAACC